MLRIRLYLASLLQNPIFLMSSLLSSSPGKSIFTEEESTQVSSYRNKKIKKQSFVDINHITFRQPGIPSRDCKREFRARQFTLSLTWRLGLVSFSSCIPKAHRKCATPNNCLLLVAICVYIGKYGHYTYQKFTHIYLISIS